MARSQTNIHALATELKRLGAIGDKLGMPIDQGIKRTVALLTLLGYDTKASCEGHLDPTHGTLGPWVDIRAHSNVRKAHKLVHDYFVYQGKLEKHYPAEFFTPYIWFFADRKRFRLQIGQEIFEEVKPEKALVPKAVRQWVYTEKQKALKKFTTYLERRYFGEL